MVTLATNNSLTKKSMEAIAQKKKRVSKKNKKAWRKHTDVKDVDEYLEDKRLEERLGVPFSERLDVELFCIDTVAEASKEEQENVTKPVKPLKTPKCFEILEIRSAVPDPIKKRNKQRTKEEKEHPLVRQIKEERAKNGVLTLKQKTAHSNRQLAEAKRESKPKRGEFTVDLWKNEGDSANDLGGNCEWLNPTTKIHTLKNTGKWHKKIPETLKKKPIMLPAIDIPHPGASYNPSYADHQLLLQEVAEKEMEIIKKEKHLKRVTSQMFTRMTPQERETMWITEASEGLPGVGAKLEEASEASGDEYKTVNPPVKNKKKTLKTRRKIKEAKLEQLQRKQMMTHKKKISDIYRLRQLNKELEIRQKKLEMLKRKREKAKALKEKEPKQLSKTKFQPPEPEFNLGEELSGNLREMKPNGNILQDRFKSLQKRSIIEPTVIQKMKRAKLKRYEKKSHKMGWEPKGY